MFIGPLLLWFKEKRRRNSYSSDITLYIVLILVKSSPIGKQRNEAQQKCSCEILMTKGRTDHLEELQHSRDGGGFRDSVTSARHWATKSSVCVRRVRLLWEIWTEPCVLLFSWPPHCVYLSVIKLPYVKRACVTALVTRQTGGPTHARRCLGRIAGL